MSRNAYERRIQRLEDERKELIRKLSDSNRALQNFAHGPAAGGGDTDANKNAENASIEIRRLQDEVNKLTKKNGGKRSSNSNFDFRKVRVYAQ